MQLHIRNKNMNIAIQYVLMCINVLMKCNAYSLMASKDAGDKMAL